MAGTIGATQQGAFATPVEGGALDASVVLGNDNTIRGKHNAHDIDPTIHVQSSSLATRPAAGTAQRVWVSTDGFRAYLDSGAAWNEFAYLPIAGGTMTGVAVFTGLTATAATVASLTATAMQITGASTHGSASVVISNAGVISSAVSGTAFQNTRVTLTGGVASALLTATAASPATALEYIVVGRGPLGAFADRVFDAAQAGSGAQTISSITMSGTPGARTYFYGGSIGVVNLTMGGAGTYTAGAVLIYTQA